jgi:hypothetical protein
LLAKDVAKSLPESRYLKQRECCFPVPGSIAYGAPHIKKAYISRGIRHVLFSAKRIKVGTFQKTDSKIA